MPEQQRESDRSDAARTVRLPRFVSDEDVGLGDIATRMSSAIGMRPCGGCKRRAAAMNRWLVFSGRKR